MAKVGQVTKLRSASSALRADRMLRSRGPEGLPAIVSGSCASCYQMPSRGASIILGTANAQSQRDLETIAAHSRHLGATRAYFAENSG